jgi:hypothetical protein
MKTVRVTLWMYALALRRSWESVSKNWIVSFAPLAYGFILSLTVSIVAPLGIIGGVILGLVSQACVSSGLYLIENVVRTGKTNFDDFAKGFTVYLWELVRISFILWIPLRIVSIALSGSGPNGGLILLLIQLALYILLNPVPEFIYQTRTSGIELLGASYNFIVENWIEWFIPNIALTLLGYFVLSGLSLLTLGLPGFGQFLVVSFGLGLCLSYIMVFRGFLFAELNGTTRRSRAYRYDARSVP